VQSVIYIKDLQKVTKRDVSIAGGKGVSLGEMAQEGIPVPKGFVILSCAFEEFLKETDLNVEINAVLNSVDSRIIHTIENASEKIQSLILKRKISNEISKEIKNSFQKLNVKFVAVRSSATSEDSIATAWAGQLESYLNTTENNLIKNVQRCWASLFTPRAIFYRFENNLQNEKISIAVVVQEMIDSEKSGIVFSVHPVTQDRNQMIIEAGFGLGEAVASGTITPDSYVISKKNNKILDVNINNQAKMLCRRTGGGNKWVSLDKRGAEQVLDKDDILELVKITKKIEGHYKSPQDIEWAYVKGKFFITQSRPITTLGDATLDRIDKHSDEYTLLFSISGYFVLTLDIIFNNDDTYGAVDFVVLYEKDISRGYLSARGMKECYDLSLLLLNNDFARNLLSESKDLISQFKKYHPISLNPKNIITEWEKSLTLSYKFGRLYRFFDQPFQQALESQVLKYIPKEELFEILSRRTLNSISNARAKKYIKRLVKMGEMKLRIHEESEKFCSDNSFEKYVSELHKLPISLVRAMRKNEIKSAMIGKMIVTTGELEKRLRGCVYIKENGKWNLYTGAKYIFWKNKMRETHSTEVSGEVVFPGVVKGRVVIHLSWTGVTQVNEGDILVSGMTNPQMVPLLKKVAAIVTDEGGITCHAAIISRELKKPCIVGTKNATQVLKDGDLVEVDANKGVVYILKRD
jgi:phosphohistidine swiveling domain-containing protein